ncbi:protein of unknown function [Oryzisolibacter propanilivorax]|uniref:DUF4390 domain-containing protein n=1 Tax=Oryzisolibacter propanilivorax TaxID=1527607 RepID=A0A1G9V8S4_9BURK|nr:protein of unknown function [Oryzisolibacter propanilivorax]
MTAVPESSAPALSLPPQAAQRRQLLRGAVAVALAPALASERVAAQQRGEVTEFVVEGTEGGVLLSTTWSMELPQLLENALYQGIALHFVAEAKVERPRWYWSDKTVAHAVRYLRLSYQPLTRRWRLVQVTGERDDSLGNASLGQTFDDLEEALSALQRIARWKIADAHALRAGVDYQVSFQFRLDTSQMPRPLQFGAVGRSSWGVALTRSIELPAEANR